MVRQLKPDWKHFEAQLLEQPDVVFNPEKPLMTW